MVLRAIALQDEQLSDADIQAMFPFKEHVSEQINFPLWVSSHLKQKPVYLIMRKNYEVDCKAYLQQNNISFEVENDYCLRLPPDSKCDALTDHGLAWIMDISSARATDAIGLNDREMVWDACSGAGGKSIFLTQKFEDRIFLTCSDKRLTILENLKARFIKLGLDLPKIELIDLTEPSHLSVKYDSIILDVPCSGSGTWGRTPEQIQSFDPEMPLRFAKIQRKIVSNALKNLKPDGKLFYLTCSVFSEENENTVKHIEVNHHFKCLNSQYFYGDHQLTDTLFFACLQSQDI